MADTKIDLRRSERALYAPSAKTASEVDVPELTFFMVNGAGEPGSADFGLAVEALFTASYKAKFSHRSLTGQDYAVMPLEGLWWSDRMDSFVKGDRKQWQWTMMIRQPDFVSHKLLRHALKAAREKTHAAIPSLRLESMREGRSVQITHIGPFSTEGPTIERLHRYVTDQGGVLDGKHHEIYLKDFRRTAPERLRTVLRQPFLAAPSSSD